MWKGLRRPLLQALMEEEEQEQGWGML